MKDLLKKLTEIQENKFLEVLNKWFSAKRKSQFILFERTRLKNKNKQEKGRNNKGDGTKTVLQKGMNK